MPCTICTLLACLQHLYSQPRKYTTVRLPPTQPGIGGRHLCELSVPFPWAARGGAMGSLLPAPGDVRPPSSCRILHHGPCLMAPWPRATWQTLLLFPSYFPPILLSPPLPSPVVARTSHRLGRSRTSPSALAAQLPDILPGPATGGTGYACRAWGTHAGRGVHVQGVGYACGA